MPVGKRRSTRGEKEALGAAAPTALVTLRRPVGSAQPGIHAVLVDEAVGRQHVNGCPWALSCSGLACVDGVVGRHEGAVSQGAGWD